MAMGAAAAVVVVLLVLYFSLGGSAAEPERIVLTRGELMGREYGSRGRRRLSARTVARVVRRGGA